MAELQRLYVTIFGDVKDLDRKLQDARRKLSEFGATAAGISRAMQLGVTLPIAAAGGVIVKAGADMDALRRALTVSAGSAEVAGRQLQELERIARMPGLGFREAIQGAVQLNVAFEGLSDKIGLSNRMLEQFGNALALTGGGRAELDRVIMQLGQMAAAGRVLTADLRPIIQTAPAVATALRQAFGTIDAGEIERLGLTSEQFFERLLQGLESLPRASRSARNSFEELSDAIFRARASVAEQLMPVVLPLIDRVTELAEEIGTAEGATLRWAAAIGAAAVAAGVLVTAIAAATKVVTALAAVAAGGLIPILGVGGALVAGLSLLAGWFVKSRIEAAVWAAETKRAAETAQDALAGLSEQELLARLAQAQREQMQLLARIQQVRQSLAAAEQAGERVAGPIRRVLQELDRQFGASVKQIAAIRKALEDLGKTGGGGGTKAAGRAPLALTLANLRRLDDALAEAREKLARLRFEAAFETQADRAARLREEIQQTTERVRLLEQAVRRAGDAMRLLSLPAPVAELAGAEWFQRAMTGRIDIATGKRQFPVIGGLMPGPGAVAEPPAVQTPELGAVTRALASFQIGLKNANLGLADAASTLGRLDLAAYVAGRTLGTIRSAAAEAGKAVGRAFLDLFNPLRIGAQSLQRSFREAERAFEPLDQALAPIVSVIADALRPAIEALAPVFRDLAPVVKALAQILGTLLKAAAPILQALVPILRALFPIIKLAAIGLTYLGQVVSVLGVVLFTVASGIAKAIGSVIEAIGKLIDKIPFVSGKGIINFGRNLKKTGDEFGQAADGFKDAFREFGEARKQIWATELEDDLGDLGDSARAVGESLRNVPTGFKVALERFRATQDVGAQDAAPTSAPGAAGQPPPAAGGETVVHDNRTIQITVVSDDVDRVWREIKRRAEQDGYRMHGTLVPAVG